LVQQNNYGVLKDCLISNTITITKFSSKHNQSNKLQFNKDRVVITLTTRFQA